MGMSGCKGEAGAGHSGQGVVTPALGAGLELEPREGGAAGLTKTLWDCLGCSVWLGG